LSQNDEARIRPIGEFLNNRSNALGERNPRNQPNPYTFCHDSQPKEEMENLGSIA